MTSVAISIRISTIGTTCAVAIAFSAISDISAIVIVHSSRPGHFIPLVLVIQIQTLLIIIAQFKFFSRQFGSTGISRQGI